MLGELTPRSIDAISSYGERLSSYIVTLAFRAFRTARRARRFAQGHRHRSTATRRPRRSSPKPTRGSQTRFRRSPRISVVVMGGFIGVNRRRRHHHARAAADRISPRPSSAPESDAEEIQIWTDVDGMLTADPTILPGGHRVKIISFAEAAELAYFGAKVLHPATVIPAIEKNIPVLILNSRRPEVPGTRIVARDRAAAAMW